MRTHTGVLLVACMVCLLAAGPAAAAPVIDGHEQVFALNPGLWGVLLDTGNIRAAAPADCSPLYAVLFPASDPACQPLFFMEYSEINGEGSLELLNGGGAPWSNPQDGDFFEAALDNFDMDDATGTLSARGTFTEVNGYRVALKGSYNPSALPVDCNQAGGFFFCYYELTDITITITYDIQPSPAVDLDIKPGAADNPLNVSSQGVLPAAVVGTADLDVAAIDPETLTLAGVAPLRWAVENVSDPGPEAYDDLTLKFETQDVVAAIEAALEGGAADGERVTLLLEGLLYDGTPIAGSDTVLIIKK